VRVGFADDSDEDQKWLLSKVIRWVSVFNNVHPIWQSTNSFAIFTGLHWSLCIIATPCSFKRESLHLL